MVYNASKSRNYHSLISCDKWNNCEEKIEIKTVDLQQCSNCSSNSCDYKEVIEVNLADRILRNTIKNGFSMRLISDKKTNSIEIPRAYLMGYLSVVQIKLIFNSFFFNNFNSSIFIFLPWRILKSNI